MSTVLLLIVQDEVTFVVFGVSVLVALTRIGPGLAAVGASRNPEGIAGPADAGAARRAGVPAWRPPRAPARSWAGARGRKPSEPPRASSRPCGMSSPAVEAGDDLGVVGVRERGRRPPTRPGRSPGR